MAIRNIEINYLLLAIWAIVAIILASTGQTSTEALFTAFFGYIFSNMLIGPGREWLNLVFVGIILAGYLLMGRAMPESGSGGTLDDNALDATFYLVFMLPIYAILWAFRGAKKKLTGSGHLAVSLGLLFLMGGTVTSCPIKFWPY